MKKPMKTKTKVEGVVAPEIVAYAETRSTTSSLVRRAIKEETDKCLGEDAEMQLGFIGGSFLGLLAKLINANVVIEVGTLTGGTTLAIAENLPAKGQVITFEKNKKVIDIAKRFWRESPHGHKISAVWGDANLNLRSLQPSCDMAVIDADKAGYSAYWEIILPLVRPGGIIVVDDVLCDGKIIRPRSKNVRTMASFNRMVAQDKRVDVVLLPMLDGLTLARKK